VADAQTLKNFFVVLDHTVGSPLDMALRLTIEGTFVYFGWKLWVIVRAIRWTPKPLVKGLISKRVVRRAGWKVFLANSLVLIPVDFIKAVTFGIPSGFYLDSNWLVDDRDSKAP